jgi:transglutaminase-like putative cysteine protease
LTCKWFGYIFETFNKFPPAILDVFPDRNQYTRGQKSIAMPDISSSNDEFSPFLQPGRYLDSDHPAVIAFARQHAGHLKLPVEIAVTLYYAVRDGIIYDPYRIDTSSHGLTASRCLEAGYGFCIVKAALLAAVGRVMGIPTRAGYADVRNHLTSPRLMAMMGTDLFIYHGFTEMYLDGHWVKATPVFNLSLCRKAGILPLEFDGQNDSIFQPLDESGRRHMEYVRERGSYPDVPREEILAAWKEVYPLSTGWLADAGTASFEQEACADVMSRPGKGIATCAP